MLVLVLFGDDDGENFDLFVEADPSGTEAVRLWQEFWGFDGDMMPSRVLVAPAARGYMRAVPWEELEEVV